MALPERIQNGNIRNDVVEKKKQPLSLLELNGIDLSAQRGDPGLNEYSYSHLNFSTEYLVELQGRQGSINYNRMSRSDDQVGMMLRLYKNPMRSANWTFVIPNDASPKDMQAIEALSEWFFNKATVTFNTLLGQILSFLEFGFSCFEIVWVPFKYEGVLYLMPEIHQRLQVSIENIYPDRGFIQQSTNKRGLVDIPLNEMVFFILDQQGLDMRGKSILRNAWVNWREKVHYKNFQSIGIQRSQTGIPTMIVPEGTDIQSKNYLACEQLLKDITCHEDAYMIIEKGYEFDIKSFNNDPKSIQEVIDSRDKKMAISVLVQFIMLGQGSGGGAFALSRDQSDMFLDGISYIVELVEQQIHKRVIEDFLRINFGDTVDCDQVRLKGLNINKKAGKLLAETLEKMSGAGFIKATIADEIQMRKYLEMPELSEEEIAKREEAANRPPPQPPGEEPVKLAEPKAQSRKEFLDIEKKQLKDVMTAKLLMVKDKLVADIRTVLNRGSVEIQGLKNIDVSWSKYAKNLERKMSGIANAGWNNAKKNSKGKKIKLTEPMDAKNLSSATLKQYVLNESQSLAEDQVTSMKVQAILTASNGPLKGYSNNQTISNVEEVIDRFIEGQKVDVGAGLAVVGSANFGEQEFYKEIEDQLWGYEFVAIDDGKTTDICLWYNGHKYSVNSPELSIATPPLHPNCRSHLKPIYKSDEPKKPEIDNQVAPPSIQKQKSIF